MKIYTAAEMREHEQMAVDKGTTFEQLMENAGQAAAADLLRRFPKAGCALIVCGKGNNGGDGLVIARVLSERDWQVDVVFVLGDKLSPLAQLNREREQVVRELIRAGQVAPSRLYAVQQGNSRFQAALACGTHGQRVPTLQTPWMLLRFSGCLKALLCGRPTGFAAHPICHRAV